MCKKEFAEKIDKAVFPGLQGGPHNHTIAAIAIALKEAATANFKRYAQQIVKNAQALAATLTQENINLITKGTDNHLLLIDVTKNNLSGQQAETLLEQAGIIVNKNTIPFDTRPPKDPSGIRLGTPLLTTRG